MPRTFFSLMLFSALCIISQCSSSNPVAGHPPSTSELIGTWAMSSAHVNQTAQIRIIVLGDTVDSNAYSDTTYVYPDSSNRYTFYPDSTYRLHGDLVNNLLPLADTGTWTLLGPSLTLHSNAGNSSTGTASTTGTALSYVTFLQTSSAPGQFITYSYTTTTTYSAWKMR